MRKQTYWLWMISNVLLALLVTGCGTAEPSPTVTSPSPTTIPVTKVTTTSTPVPPTAEASAPTPVAPVYIGVDIAAANLQVEVPESWTRLEPDWVWAPEQESELRLGVKWEDLNPPQEPEAVLLPDNAQIVATSEVELAMGSGRRFLMNIYGPTVDGSDEEAPVETVQIHVLVIQSGEVRRGYDFYAVAPDEEALSEVEPRLQHLIETATL